MSTRMTITFDDAVLGEVTRFFAASTKAESIRRALESAVRQARLERALEHAGEVEIDLDQERLAALREGS